MWDEEAHKPERKANILMEAIQKNEEHKDIADILQQKVIENEDFDWKDRNAVKNILEIIKEEVEESMWTRNVEASKELFRFKQNDDETEMKYINRFGRLEGQLNNAKAGVSNMFLATIFLNQSNLDQVQKENIIAMVDLNDERNVLTNIRKKFKTLKASSKKKEEPKTTFYGDYGRRGSSNRGEERRGSFNRDNGRSGSFNRGDGRSGSFNRGYDKPRDSGNEENPQRERSVFKGRERSNGRRGSRRSFSRGRNDGNNRDRYHRDRSKSFDRRGKYGPKNVFKCTKLNIDQNRTIFENEIENLAVMDSGCPEPVVGKAWLKTFENSTGQTYPVIEKKETFQFGDTICEAEYYKEIPVELGRMKKKMKVAVVETNIPFLLSLEELISWGSVVDFSDQTLKIKSTGETFKLKRTKSNHLAIALSKRAEEDKEELMRKVFKVKKAKKYQFKELKKIHRIFGHPRPEKLEKIFKDSGVEDKSIMKKIGRVFESCKICRKYQRRDSKPKVGLPKASNVNE